MVYRFLLAVAAAVTLCTQQARAHPFWIEPQTPRVAVGDTITARTFIGEYLSGEELAKFSEMRRVADVSLGDSVVPLEGRDGDAPAIVTPSLGNGLHVLRIQSRNFDVTYASFELFEKFLHEAERTDLLPLYAPGGLPHDPISEVFFRYAKALVPVGDGTGADRYLGMPFELVALTNPVAPPPAQMLVEVRFLGVPLPGAAVHVFFRAPDGTVSDMRLRTDEQGVVRVPATPGFTLINAIHLLPATRQMERTLGARWQSLWASLTYTIE